MKFVVAFAVLVATVAASPYMNQEWRVNYPGLRAILPIQFYPQVVYTYPKEVIPYEDLTTLRFIYPYGKIAKIADEEKIITVVPTSVEKEHEAGTTGEDKTLKVAVTDEKDVKVVVADDQKVLSVVHSGDEKEVKLGYVYDPEEFYNIYGYYPKH